MRMFTFMTPAIFCGILSFVALLGGVRGGAKWWQALFYASLPASFLIVGGLLYQVSRESSRLRRRLGRLEQRLEKSGELRPSLPAHRDDDDD